MALGTKPELSPSDDTNQAKKDWENAEQKWQNRDAFDSPYDEQLNQITDQITNRDPFSYDYNTDTIYLGYKDRYTKSGQMAQRDAQAQAQAMTGGYGSSYAAQAGSNAYSEYIDKLMDTIPELEEQAYSRYQDETNNLYNQAELLKDLRDTDYQKYRDTMEDLYNDMIYYQDKYNGLSDKDLEYYKLHLEEWLSDREYYYQKGLLDEENQQLENQQTYGG